MGQLLHYLYSLHAFHTLWKIELTQRPNEQLFFNKWPTILKFNVRGRIYHILTCIYTNVDLNKKIWRFIEVEWTINIYIDIDNPNHIDRTDGIMTKRSIHIYFRYFVFLDRTNGCMVKLLQTRYSLEYKGDIKS